MHEIAEIADDCTIFRNGHNVATYTAGSKTDNEVVELMIGREYSHQFPPKPQAHVSDKPPVLEAQQPRLDPTGCATFRSRRGPARSSASAASTGRASANCCWPCSGCCAASRAKC